jgi:hypothetical protein
VEADILSGLSLFVVDLAVVLEQVLLYWSRHLLVEVDELRLGRNDVVVLTEVVVPPRSIV